MSTLNAATGAPIPGLFKHAGKSYTLSPLMLADFAEVNAYVRAWPVTALKYHLDGMPPEQSGMILAYAYEKLETGLFTEPTQELYELALQNVVGQTYALFCSLRQTQPDIELAAVRPMITRENRDEVLRLLILAGSWSAMEKHGDPQPSPTA